MTNQNKNDFASSLPSAATQTLEFVIARVAPLLASNSL